MTTSVQSVLGRLTLAQLASLGTFSTLIKRAKRLVALKIRPLLTVSAQRVKSLATNVKDLSAPARPALIPTLCTWARSVSNTALSSTRMQTMCVSMRVSSAQLASS